MSVERYGVELLNKEKVSLKAAGSMHTARYEQSLVDLYMHRLRGGELEEEDEEEEEEDNGSAEERARLTNDKKQFEAWLRSHPKESASLESYQKYAAERLAASSKGSGKFGTLLFCFDLTLILLLFFFFFFFFFFFLWLFFCRQAAEHYSQQAES